MHNKGEHVPTYMYICVVLVQVRPPADSFSFVFGPSLFPAMRVPGVTLLSLTAHTHRKRQEVDMPPEDDEKTREQTWKSTSPENNRVNICF